MQNRHVNEIDTDAATTSIADADAVTAMVGARIQAAEAAAPSM